MEIITSELALYIVGGILLLFVARKPTIALARTILKKKVTKLEIEHYTLLREEISKLNKLLVEEQRQKQELVIQNTKLLTKVQELSLQLESFRQRIDHLEAR